MARTLVFLASSLDGFIAGPDDEIDWLSGYQDVEDTFTPFFAGIGAMLMGRRTFDVVSDFDGAWPYGDTPVLVATRSRIASPEPSVRAVSGTIQEVVEQAKRSAGDRDVYLDGGALTRSALAAGLVDELTLTMIPIALGEGISLFGGVSGRQPFELIGSRELGRGLVQLKYRPGSVANR